MTIKAEEIEYVLTGEIGPDHDKTFVVKSGSRETRHWAKEREGPRKAAEQEAAYRAIIKLERKCTESMYLKSLEVQGFKSFANKIDV